MTTKIKTHELLGAALDYAVAKAEYTDGRWFGQHFGVAVAVETAPGSGFQMRFYPSENWNDAGPIIQREGISIIRCDDDWGVDAKGFCNNVRIPVWGATTGQRGWDETTEHQQHDPMYQIYTSDVTYGPTPLIAAMRCYVASKLGEEVEIPDELGVPS